MMQSRKSLVELKNEYQQAVVANESLSLELESLKAEEAETKNEIEALHESVEDLTEQKSSLKQELEKIKNTVHALKRDIDRQNQEIKRIADESRPVLDLVGGLLKNRRPVAYVRTVGMFSSREAGDDEEQALSLSPK
jgi:chromosome segregation ATPase